MLFIIPFAFSYYIYHIMYKKWKNSRIEIWAAWKTTQMKINAFCRHIWLASWKTECNKILEGCCTPKKSTMLKAFGENSKMLCVFRPCHKKIRLNRRRIYFSFVFKNLSPKKQKWSSIPLMNFQTVWIY